MGVKQISVFLENRAGRLWELCNILAKNNINIRALSLGEAADFGIARMIVGDPDLTNEVLGDAGFTVAETDVLAVEIPDIPGGLAKALEALKNKNLNVEYAYAFIAKSGEMVVVSMKINAIDEAESALQEAGFTLLTPEKLYSL
jgi:hypothetical protein